MAPGGGEGFGGEGAAEEWGVGVLMEVEADDVENFNFVFVAVERDEYGDGGDLAFFEDAEIVAQAHGVEEALDHVIAAKFDAELVAGHARLDGEDFRGADLKTVADVDGVFGESRGGEIFAECAPGKIDFGEFGAPIGVVFAGVDVDGFIGAAVDGEIRLAVAIEIEGAEMDGPFDGRFEDAGFDLLAVPVDGLREADLEGKDFGGHGGDDYSARAQEWRKRRFLKAETRRSEERHYLSCPFAEFHSGGVRRVRRIWAARWPR